ncbi:ABC transporter permease [Actinocrinis puniceicyclus]|uniref:ABC transporter permease n=1 Tax=Actinocrinis puniceicyclus TaxID=977794 RepID=A0A8J7WLR0_9ACTN|nr:ABC transporter permease [Actinocrinis puniceicyclus]MBS2961815.1 ABC transporter permease [Actinocrinis puniceicyclus]
MLTYIVRRLLAAVGLLLVVTLITFWIFYILPLWAGQTPQSLAAAYVGKQQDPLALRAVVDRFGFDKPLFAQYFDYVIGIVHGRTYSDGVSLIHCNAPCFGYSFKNYEQVWPTLLSRAPVTVSIALGAGVLWLVFGVLSGVISAVRKGSIADRVSMGIALAGVALPVYFVGPLLEALTGRWNTTYVPFLSNPFQWAQHLSIPWVALAFGYAALYARMTRAGMLDALNEDFVRTARAKGVRERKVLYRHALRSALTPIITIFGMDLGAVLGGAVLLEVTFSLPGLGLLAINSIQQDDFPVVMGVTLLAAFFIVVANIVVDVFYAVVDPRVRLA